ncbi:hypothetical protein [Streptomyces sp. JJ36]|uniref:hypothetical protein n=1 Tax=Streptomyces sp. JJ36 TaxID=2736645 RepID=UPI001F44C854|nr:hypothetical protein [Streptomyces sp. JJ36]MCF6521526.1 hypothetical protein [Streptomyces sp. JJ36]
MHRLLYVSDPTFPARGRDYGREDIELMRRLEEEFVLAMCSPRQVVELMGGFDAVVVRNSGPVLADPGAWERFRDAALASGTRVYNELTGKADMRGKDYLPELAAAGYPVIPTVTSPADPDRLPAAPRYVVKPLQGADSIGLRVLGPAEVRALAEPGLLVQPELDFAYEVSFYFVDGTLVYALHTPDPAHRWELTPYAPTPDDVRFARRFVEWNAVRHGIQRVDAMRTGDGRLLLVELEDLNPYLSLDRTAPEARERFVAEFRAALHRLLEQ